MATEAANIYSPINSSNSEFRLLLLKRGRREDKISCELRTMSLTCTPTYRALSYVWGKANDVVPINLNGHEFEVKKNLHDALDQLRVVHCDMWFWIDAICIDQSNVEERSQQVTLMKCIYQSADLVISWLGLDAEAKLRTARNLYFEAGAYSFHPSWFLKGIFEAEDPDALWRFISQLKDLEDVLSAVNAIQESQSDHYWTRAWITQEVAVARSVFLVSGDVGMSEAMIQQLLQPFRHGTLQDPDGSLLVQQYIQHTSSELLSIYGIWLMRLNNIWWTTDIGRRIHHTGPADLGTLLVRFRHKQSTDPRDKVYALLGVAEDAGDIIVDYTKESRGVYIEAFQSVLRSTNSLNILVFSQPWLPRTEEFKHLPTWCPDWSMSKHPIIDAANAFKWDGTASTESTRNFQT